MRLNVLAVMGLIAALGLAAAIVALPVMAEKGPLRATLVAHLGGGQEEEVQGGGNPEGRGRAVVKVFEEKLCAKVKTGAIESSSSKATIHLGMRGEKGPTVANLHEERVATPTRSTTGTTTGTTTATTGTTGTTGAQTGTTTTPQAIAHWRRLLLLRRPPRRCRRRPLPPSPPLPRRLAHQLAHRLVHRLVHPLVRRLRDPGALTF